MKKNLLFIAVSILFIAGCCNDSCITQDKCNAKFPCPVMTKEECMSHYSLGETGSRPGPGCIINISETTATEYINRFIATHADKTGMFVPSCALYQVVADSNATAVGLNFGLSPAPDNIHCIIIKYQLPDGTIYWGNVEFGPSFGEPHCPPGTKCS